MSSPAEPKLKSITILGREHLPSTGVLIIPSQLSFLDLSEYPQLAAINNQSVDLKSYNALLPSSKTTPLLDGTGTGVGAAKAVAQ